MTATPPNKPRSLSTGPVRMRLDLIEKLDAITWARGLATSADGIDAVLREEIERQFDALPDAIRQRAIGRIAEAEAGE